MAQEIKSNIIGIGKDPENNNFSIGKENGFLVMKYKGQTIPFQTAMTIKNTIDDKECMSVEITINCFVKLDDFIK